MADDLSAMLRDVGPGVILFCLPRPNECDDHLPVDQPWVAGLAYNRGYLEAGDRYIDVHMGTHATGATPEQAVEGLIAQLLPEEFYGRK